MLGTQLKEHHLLFIVSFVFTRDRSGEYSSCSLSASARFLERFWVLLPLKKTNWLMCTHSVCQVKKTEWWMHRKICLFSLILSPFLYLWEVLTYMTSVLGLKNDLKTTCFRTNHVFTLSCLSLRQRVWILFQDQFDSPWLSLALDLVSTLTLKVLVLSRPRYTLVSVMTWSWFRWSWLYHSLWGKKV